VANMITSRRFAERWPFAAAIVVVAAFAMALSFLPSTVPWETVYFCLFVIGSLWSDVIELRIYGIGFSPKKWQLLFVNLLIISPALLYSLNSTRRNASLPPRSSWPYKPLSLR
jgi:multidrug transporter EmrE-like cation transporter